ncbi:hypothetical protein JOB18_017062 [Solea senegalensis]|uniref:Uncharacterized protein n=1 Tax=Solea senegalensis TaxID=28829 RepID=A0AAV6QP62_SOLSE|nr:hypothetical protein JOB18_017062 [Solea senegalensis]
MHSVVVTGKREKYRSTAQVWTQTEKRNTASLLSEVLVFVSQVSQHLNAGSSINRTSRNNTISKSPTPAIIIQMISFNTKKPGRAPYVDRRQLQVRIETDNNSQGSRVGLILVFSAAVLLTQVQAQSSTASLDLYYIDNSH